MRHGTPNFLLGGGISLSARGRRLKKDWEEERSQTREVLFCRAGGIAL